jgi:hypothetical protein
VNSSNLILSSSTPSAAMAAEAERIIGSGPQM